MFDFIDKFYHIRNLHVTCQASKIHALTKLSF